MSDYLQKLRLVRLVEDLVCLQQIVVLRSLLFHTHTQHLGLPLSLVFQLQIDSFHVLQQLGRFLKDILTLLTLVSKD